MGAEVVEQAIPAFERKWDRAFRRLCEGGLFSREPELAKRRFPATPIGVPRTFNAEPKTVRSMVIPSASGPMSRSVFALTRVRETTGNAVGATTGTGAAETGAAVGTGTGAAVGGV